MEAVTQERVADRGWAAGSIDREIRQYSRERQVVVCCPVPVRLSKRERSSLILRRHSRRIIVRYAQRVGDEDLLEFFSAQVFLICKTCSSYLEERNERSMPGREQYFLAYTLAHLDSPKLHVPYLTP